MDVMFQMNVFDYTVGALLDIIYRRSLYINYVSSYFELSDSKLKIALDALVLPFAAVGVYLLCYY